MRALMSFFLVVMFSGQLCATTKTGDYSAAEDAFRQGQFSQASKIYLEAIQEGHSNASIFYNLGTSLYKNGEMGAAVAAHLRARSLRPDDPDIRYNLRFLQEKAKDKLDMNRPERSWEKLSAAHWMGQRSLFWSMIIPLVLAFWSVAWTLLTGRRPALLWSLGIVLFLVSVYPGLSLVDALWRSPDWGAVVSNELDVLASPTVKNSVVIFQLHEGAPFMVVNQSGDWFKIQLSDGKTGWAKGEGLAIFGKTYFSYQSPKTDSSSL